MIPRRSLFLVVAFVVALAGLCRADEPATRALTASAVRAEGGVGLREWRYRPGDDVAWADPALDDASWEIVSPTIAPDSPPASGWTGIGWFRVKLRTTEPLGPTALDLWLDGAADLYVDGRLVGNLGGVGATTDVEWPLGTRAAPVTIPVDTPGDHVIALRYSCARTGVAAGALGRWLWAMRRNAGFSGRLFTSSRAAAEYGDDQTVGLRNFVIPAVVFFALGLLHLFIFLFYRQRRVDLIYAVAVFALGSLCVALYARYFSLDPLRFVVCEAVMRVSGTVALPAFLLFAYRAFGPRVPRHFAGILAIWALSIPAFFLSRWFAALDAFIYVGLAVSGLEAIRVAAVATWRRAPGAWIVALGVASLALLFVGAAVGDFSPTVSRALDVATPVLFLLFPFAVSVYLAREFARSNRELEARLVEVHELSAAAIERERREAELRVAHQHALAENERRAAELEEARQLQLSMLPTKLPTPPGLDVAAYMKPATEVGGDYYDFHVAEDGTLTVAVGDATGHGLKAGTLVTATKGLFNVLAAEPDIRTILRDASAALKAMNLRRMYMAIAIAKVRDGRLRVSAAGMPPMLVYRAATGEVETVTIPDMPLGSVPGFPYREVELELAPGDTVLLMSDGLPERFNEANEMFDEVRVAALLGEHGALSPAAIIERLVEAGDRWAGARAQDDDITFVVVRRHRSQCRER